MTPADPCSRLARLTGFGTAAILAVAVAGCSGDAGDPYDASPPSACASGASGLDCLFTLWDLVRADCAPDAAAAFVASIDRRHGDLPAWHRGRALFVTRGAPAAIVGDMNAWRVGDLTTTPVCATGLFAVEAAMASGRASYTLAVDGIAKLDPENFAFAYDDRPGNVGGKTSVLNSYDSRFGTLVRPDEEVCSEVLGNCRPFTTYLPPGYGSPENADRRYPVLFMHDGQNIFDDPDCCRDAYTQPLHTGWQINRTLDDEIAAGRVEPVVVVGFDAVLRRGDEYAAERREQFVEFQVGQVQPRAAALWRLDQERVYVAGSSFGGNITMLLAFTHPEIYAGAASLSGAFQWEYGTPLAIFEIVARRGKIPVALYLDHGDGPGDRPWLTIEMRDLLVELGWVLHDAAGCRPGVDDLCYFYEQGAEHDEFAWGRRAPLFLRAFFSPAAISP